MSEISNADNADNAAAHNIADDSDKVAGLVEQIRQDAAQGTITDAADELRRRLADSGITLDAAEFERTLAAVLVPPTA